MKEIKLTVRAVTRTYFQGKGQAGAKGGQANCKNISIYTYSMNLKYFKNCVKIKFCKTWKKLKKV